MPTIISGTTGISTPDGSASVPPYTGSSGATNGLYFPSATSMALAANGSVALTIDSSQNVGIGTASPSQKLNINSSASTCVRLETTSATSQTYFNAVSSSGTSTQLTTIGPSQASYGIITAGMSTVYSNSNVGLAIGTDGAGPVMFYTNSAASERMRITNAGYLLVGTTTPSGISNALIQSNAGISIGNNAGGTTNRLWLAGADTSHYIYSTGSSGNVMVFGSYAAWQWYQGSSSTTVMTLDASGNLMVGTTGATGKITTYNTFGYAIQSSASAQADYLSYGATGSLANATGSAYYWRRNYDNVIQFQFDGAGNAAKASGAGSWNAYSDERLKTNIKKISDGLNNILSLNPVSFDYKIPEAHGNKKSDKGFLAGEFEKTYPNSVVCSNSMITDAEKEFVSEEDPAKLLGFNAEFYADLVSAIQELAAEVEALKKKVA